MAVGDRVVIGDGAIWDDSVTVSVYEPLWEGDGSLRLDHFKAATIQRMGGVKGGSTGTIAGPSIRVHRTQLFGEQNIATMGGVDLVHVFPIQLDKYMRLGWMPAQHIRVAFGGMAP